MSVDMIRMANRPKKYFFILGTVGNSKIDLTDLTCVELVMYVLMCIIHPFETCTPFLIRKK